MKQSITGGWRFVTLLTTALLCGALLGGCGGDQKPSASTGKTTTATATAAGDDTNETQESDETLGTGETGETSPGGQTDPAGPNKTSSGKTATKAGGKATSKVTSAKPTKAPSYDLKGRVFEMIGVNAPQESSLNYKEEVKFVKSLENKYHCTIKFTPGNWSDNYENFQRKTLAGQPYGDIVWLDSALVYPHLMVNNLAMPIDDYFDWDLPQWNKEHNESLKVGSKHYCITNSGYGVGTGVFFNKEIFKRLGVTTPYEYIKKNTWNWDNFLKTAKALTKDTNKDGKIDIWGLGAGGACPSAPLDFVYSNGGRITKMVNGKMTFALDTPEAIEGIQFAYDLMHTHNVCEPLSGTEEFGFWEKRWRAGTIGMFISASYSWESYKKDLKDYGVGFAYIPMGPKMKHYVNNLTPLGAYFMNKYTKDPAASAALLTDWCAKRPYAVDNKTYWESIVDDEDALKVVLDVPQYTVDDWYQSYNWVRQNVGWSTFGLTNKVSPQAFIASVKAAAQKDIDNTWKKIEDMD